MMGRSFFKRSWAFAPAGTCSCSTQAMRVGKVGSRGWREADSEWRKVHCSSWGGSVPGGGKGGCFPWMLHCPLQLLRDCPCQARASGPIAGPEVGKLAKTQQRLGVLGCPSCGQS